MIFCGQCGLQLAPGSTRCPRCGATVEVADAVVGELHPDAATVASPSFIPPGQGMTPNQRPPLTPNSQQPLILRENSSYDYGAPDAYGATNRVEQVNYNTRMPSQGIGNSYAGYPQQQNTGYPPQNGYPVQNTAGYLPPASYPDYGNAGYQPGTSYPGMVPQMGTGYQQLPGQYQQPSTNAKGRTTGLILILLGLVLILSAAFLFAMQQGIIGGHRASGGTPPVAAIQHVQSISPQDHGCTIEHPCFVYLNGQEPHFLSGNEHGNTSTLQLRRL